MTNEQPQCTCLSNKGTSKSAFPSQYAAESWYALKQKENGWTEPQRAYKCPQSSVWHLTTDFESRTAIPIAQVDYKQAETKAKVTFAERIRKIDAEEPGLSAEAVAKRLGCEVHNVYSTRSKAKSGTATKAPAPVKSLSGVLDRKRQLAEEMARLEAEEKRMREALLPKVQVFGNNGETQVRITCNDQSMIIALEAVGALKSQLAEVG